MAGDPRIRGEHEDKRYADWDRAGSSPHTRGALVMVTHTFYYIRIIPAYAGSTASPPSMTAVRRDHPRIRGEHLRGFLEVPGYGGSSPHTRGAHKPFEVGDVFSRIIPAYAGSTSRIPLTA